MLSTREMFERRRQRNRDSLKKSANGQLRLSIHRTSQHIYAQIIDDAKGKTLVSASTLNADFKKAGKTGADVSAASAVGKAMGELALKLDIMLFDINISVNTYGSVSVVAVH